METDDTDFQIISINTTEKRKGQIYKSIYYIFNFFFLFFIWNIIRYDWKYFIFKVFDFLLF